MERLATHIAGRSLLVVGYAPDNPGATVNLSRRQAYLVGMTKAHIVIAQTALVEAVINTGNALPNSELPAHLSHALSLVGEALDSAYRVVGDAELLKEQP